MKRYQPLRVALLCISLFVVCQGLCQAGLMTLKGTSMEPTIKDGNKIWISNYGKGENPSRGDIIAFNLEKGISIKRIIGLPEEKVIIKDGVVSVVNQGNPEGQELEEPYLAPGTKTGPDGEFSIPKGRYFVLGDNRGNSLDSRAFGCIAREKIIGKATKIF